MIRRARNLQDTGVVRQTYRRRSVWRRVSRIFFCFFRTTVLTTGIMHAVTEKVHVSNQTLCLVWEIYANTDLYCRVGHRCHSCQTTETPEWRRGPDGARTLCNACGLRELFKASLFSSLPPSRFTLLTLIFFPCKTTRNSCGRGPSRCNPRIHGI